MKQLLTLSLSVLLVTAQQMSGMGFEKDPHYSYLEPIYETKKVPLNQKWPNDFNLKESKNKLSQIHHEIHFALKKATDLNTYKVPVVADFYNPLRNQLPKWELKDNNPFPINMVKTAMKLAAEDVQLLSHVKTEDLQSHQQELKTSLIMCEVENLRNLKNAHPVVSVYFAEFYLYGKDVSIIDTDQALFFDAVLRKWTAILLRSQEGD